MSTLMYSIVIYTPLTHADGVRAALAGSGAGAIGQYDSCSFSCRGTGRFRPLAGANPAIGRAGGPVEEVEEERIETVILAPAADPFPVLQRICAAVKAAHPYEEPAFHLTQVLDYKPFLQLGGSRNGSSSTAATAAAAAAAAAAIASSDAGSK